MLYIYLYWVKHEKIFFSKTTRPRALIFGLKHHLEDFYQVCINYILYKWPRPKGHMFYMGLHREQHETIFLSETKMPRALILVM